MISKYAGKNLITLEDWSRQEIDDLLDMSGQLKTKFAAREETEYLKNQTVFLMFFEQSTRTRNSMEAGITQLGGHAHFMDSSSMQIAHGEVAKDTAIILSRYGHAIACRNCVWGQGNGYLSDLARWATVPVINMQDDLYHPLQALADLMTMQEKLATLKGKKVAIIWAYATSHKKPISVPLSQMLLFPRYGMDVTLAHPEGYDLPDWVMARAQAHAAEQGGQVSLTHDQEAAYRDADVVIPKSWGSWVTDQGNVVVDDRLESNRGWKCTAERTALGNEGVIYMHALPADRGNEVEDEVIDGPHSVVYDEAENRLHTAKAVMALTMKAN